MLALSPKRRYGNMTQPLVVNHRIYFAWNHFLQFVAVLFYLFIGFRCFCSSRTTLPHGMPCHLSLGHWCWSQVSVILFISPLPYLSSFPVAVSKVSKNESKNPVVPARCMPYISISTVLSTFLKKWSTFAHRCDRSSFKVSCIPSNKRYVSSLASKTDLSLCFCLNSRRMCHILSPVETKQRKICVHFFTHPQQKPLIDILNHETA